MIKVGDKVMFRRNGELSEGFAVVAAVWPEIQSVDLDGVPVGVLPGDDLVFEFGSDWIESICSVDES